MCVCVCVSLSLSLCVREREKVRKRERVCVCVTAEISFNLYYHGESKVLQYLGNVIHNSTAHNAFAEVVKVTNHNGQWDVKLVWRTTLGRPDFDWSSIFLQLERNFLNHLICSSCLLVQTWKRLYRKLAVVHAVGFFFPQHRICPKEGQIAIKCNISIATGVARISMITRFKIKVGKTLKCM